LIILVKFFCFKSNSSSDYFSEIFESLWEFKVDKKTEDFFDPLWDFSFLFLDFDLYGGLFEAYIL
jgi:hypothetical protein